MTYLSNGNQQTPEVVLNNLIPQADTAMYLKLFHRPQHNSVSSAKQEGTTQSGGNILWHGNELDSNEQCPTSSS